MKIRVPVLCAAGVPLLILSGMLFAGASQPGVENQRIDRLVALAKSWAAVKYFYPYVAYRNDIDWDQAPFTGKD